MNELHDLLDRATDRLESPDLAANAMAVARRRRTRRRSVLTASGAAALVLAIALVGQLNRRDVDSAPPVTPSPPRTDITQGPWGPRDVDELPPAAADVAPALPDVVDPPVSATPLAADSVDAAVLSFRGNDDVELLATDGTWRSVPLDSEYGDSELTRDGTRLAVETETGVDIWDLPTGERTRLANPQGYRPRDVYPIWAWIDNSTLLFDDPNPGGWLVDSASGEATRVPYPFDSGSRTVDAAGVVVESSDFGKPARLVDWAGEVPRWVDMTGIGRLSTIHADAETVVGTSGAKVVVANRVDLAPRHVLPLVDPEANYADGKLPIAALLDDGTLLLQVPVFGDEFSWRLVAWDPRSGELTRVLRGAGSVPASYATDLLG